MSRCTPTDALARLRPHVLVEEVALTGGVALELHLGPRRPIGDIDLVARSLAAVGASAMRNFLVAHHHVEPRPILQLVDPAARLRIDVFVDRAGALARARPSALGWLVLDPRDLLAHKVRTLAGGPVDEKHHRDAVALAALLGVPPPPRPSAFRPDSYCRDLDARCDRCVAAGFPIAPRREVFDVLGYV